MSKNSDDSDDSKDLNNEDDECECKIFFTEILKCLKPYRLIIGKTYEFIGTILVNKSEPIFCKCSLTITTNSNKNYEYLLQIHTKNNIIKPIKKICLMDNRGISSNFDGFNLSYQTIDQSLNFHTTNSNDLIGKFILNDALIEPDYSCGGCYTATGFGSCLGYVTSCGYCAKGDCC